MELSEIRTRIDAVDDQLLKLFLERMELAEEVAAYKNEHHLPILNKQREREILAKVTAKAGDKERYAYHLYSTLFELARSRQAELVDLPTRVAERVEKSLAAGGPVFPQTGLVACQGVEGANSQVACDRLLPRGSILCHLLTIGDDKGLLLDATIGPIMGDDIAQVATCHIAVVAPIVACHHQAIGGHHRAVQLAALHHQGHCRPIALPVGKRHRLGGNGRHDAMGYRHGQYRRSQSLKPCHYYLSDFWRCSVT